MAKWLEAQWYQKCFWKLLPLYPLSCFYRVMIYLRLKAYQLGILARVKLPVPVVIVGNITVGGTGKTPLVIWLVEQLQALGYQPGVISRGYGAQNVGVAEVLAHSNPQAVGDEPLLIKQRLDIPVFISRERVAAGRALLKAYPQCNIIISDDGLQHYALARDIEIAVIDAERGLGNAQLLPMGPLREPKSRLHEVDFIVSNGQSAEQDDMRIFNMQLIASEFVSVTQSSRRVVADYFHGKKSVAVAGIGNPSRFFNQLRTMGVDASSVEFPDHHAFKMHELDLLQADAIIMTEKDAVKCRQFQYENLWYLPVRAGLPTALVQAITNKLQ